MYYLYMENILIKNAFNSYKILLEMLNDRNYIIKKEHHKDINLFAKDYEDNINLIFKKENKQEIYVSILNNIKITKKDLLKIIENIRDNNNIDNILILCNEKQLLNYISEYKIKFKINLEIFLINNMQINISKHDFQPKFILLTSDEKKQFLEKNGYIDSQLPKILSNDPMCLYYNGKNGDVFKIIRNSMEGRNKTSGQGIYYRIVIDPKK